MLFLLDKPSLLKRARTEQVASGEPDAKKENGLHMRNAKDSRIHLSSDLKLQPNK